VKKAWLLQKQGMHFQYHRTVGSTTKNIE
jgi:hypothetical protein